MMCHFNGLSDPHDMHDSYTLGTVQRQGLNPLFMAKLTTTLNKLQVLNDRCLWLGLAKEDYL